MIQMTDNRFLASVLGTLAKVDATVRLQEMIELFPKNHPLKLIQVWYAFLTGKKYLQISEDGKTGYSAKKYLSNYYNVFTEYFDALEGLQSSTLTEYANCLGPLLKRAALQGLSGDQNMIKNVISFLNAERADFSALSARLNLPTAVIDFMMFLMRMHAIIEDDDVYTAEKLESEEIAFYENNSEMHAVCRALKISDPDEFFGVLRLVCCAIPNQDSFCKILKNMGLTHKINDIMVYSLIQLNKGVDCRMNINNTSQQLLTIEKTLSNFLGQLHLDPSYGVFMTRLMLGDFLVIENRKSKLNWMITIVTTKTITETNANGSVITVDPDQEKALQFYHYLHHCKEVLNMDSLKVKAAARSKPAVQQTDPDTWNSILKKIQQGELNPDDLFHVLNRGGGGSGQIGIAQFQTLVSRLGLQLSDHRVKEIFAKVKGEDSSNSSGKPLTLNHKEFGVAMVYVMEKALRTAMETLGLTEEQLAVLLIVLILLFILLLVFIFVGIEAFALGGSFGAVINSMFPMLGGGAMGKKSDGDKEKTTGQSLMKAVKHAVAIIQAKTDSSNTSSNNQSSTAPSAAATGN
jgi:hypothetical protein